MKGNHKILAALNDLLAYELTAIHPYMEQDETAEHWGCVKQRKLADERAVIKKKKHAERLIERILILEGRPIVSKRNPSRNESAPPPPHDFIAEMVAVINYHNAIRIALSEGDHATKEVLESILSDGSCHAV